MKKSLIYPLIGGCFSLLGLVCSQPMSAQKNQMPLVFSVENTGAKFAEPKYGTADQMPDVAKSRQRTWRSGNSVARKSPTRFSTMR